MDIHLTVELGSDGRLSGAVHGPAGSDVQPFSGVLELVARLEDLCVLDRGDVHRGEADSEPRQGPISGSINPQHVKGDGQ